MKQPELGRKISELRKSKGLTQEELVELCNISVRTIQRIETGEVTPRSYTIKTILSALGCDLSDLEENSSYSENLIRSLNIAWILGIAYLILGLLEGPLDMIRISRETAETVGYGFFPVTDYSQSFYVVVKILVLLTYMFFLRGFVSIGAIANYSLLRTTASMLICFMVFSIGYDILSLFYTPVDRMLVLPGVSVFFGVLGIMFGIALIKLQSSLGAVCAIAGALEIIAGCFFIFVNPLGFPLQMLAGLLDVIVIYKSTQVTPFSPSTLKHFA